MILIGHRGCSYPGYNQNTIRAFNKVAQEGVPAVLVYTVNSPDELQALAHMGEDGIITDYYLESASVLAPYIDPRS